MFSLCAPAQVVFKMSKEGITGHTVLEITHLKLVLKELKLFGKHNWQRFGLEAGLYDNKLQAIKANNPGNVGTCLHECVASWLRREDNVDVEGKPTLLRLADIVEEAEDRAAADEIRKTIKKKDEEERKRNTEYTGRMYHIKKEDGHCVTCYTVTRDLEQLKKYLRHEHPKAEIEETVDTFCFLQPDGKLQLHIKWPPLQENENGWSVYPEQKPMTILQSTVDKFPKNPLYSSVSISVYAEPGVATKPLHCPIELTGIVPKKTIYIHRHRPPLPRPSPNIDNTANVMQNNIQNYQRENFDRCYGENTLKILKWILSQKANGHLYYQRLAELAKLAEEVDMLAGKLYDDIMNSTGDT